MGRKYFHFPNGEVFQAISEWWGLQKAKGKEYTRFDIDAVGNNTDICVSESSLDDQSGFQKYLEEHYSGTYTVHESRQVKAFG